jgi:catalase
LKEPALRLTGDADRYDHHHNADNYSQVTALYRLMNIDQKDQLINNLVAVLKTVPREIQERQLGHFYLADPDYGRRVAEGLGIQ